MNFGKSKLPSNLSWGSLSRHTSYQTSTIQKMQWKWRMQLHNSIGCLTFTAARPRYKKYAQRSQPQWPDQSQPGRKGPAGERNMILHISRTTFSIWLKVHQFTIHRNHRKKSSQLTHMNSPTVLLKVLTHKNRRELDDESRKRQLSRQCLF